MAATKVTREDAQEWLESLQDVGSGWWRQVGLAVKMGAHTALDMDRREFAAQIGHRLIDPKDAIVDLFGEKMSQKAIAEVLGISTHRVQRVLMEEGLIPVRELPAAGGPSLFGTPGRPADPRLKETYADGTGSDEETYAEGTAEEPDAQVEGLLAALEAKEREVSAAKAKAKADLDRLREQLKSAREDRADLQRQLEEAKQEELSEADKARLAKEREAMTAAIEARFAPVHAGHIVENLVDARETLLELIELGLNESLYDKIEAAHGRFANELTVAAAAVGREVRMT